MCVWGGGGGGVSVCVFICVRAWWAVVSISWALLVLLCAVGELIQFINSKMSRSEQAPLFIYADNEIVVSPTNIMSELYQEFREDDFFLYLAYYEENIYHHQRHFSKSASGGVTSQ